MHVLLTNRHLTYLLLSCFMILSSFYLVRNKHEYSMSSATKSDEVKLNSFYQTWCNVRKLRRDWKKILQPCEGLLKWGSTREGWQEPTDPQASVIVAMDIRPTYEFSSILIETRTRDNIRKKIGGDSWRVHLKGPSFPSTTVFDHQNGTYEIVFLVIEPGVYTLHTYLEHSLCDGLKEPPDNWFVIGNAQGKFQAEGSLGSDNAYISKKLHHVPEIVVKGQSSQQYEEAVRILMENGSKVCKDTCNFIWDGYGRWIDDKWYPFQTNQGGEMEKEELMTEVLPNHDGIMWLYGDSVMAQFYSNVKLFGKICFLFTGGCGHTYNWVYKIIDYNTTRAKTENDDKDFNRTRILTEVNDVLRFTTFNKPSSVLFINFGLHFTESSSFSNYKKLIQDFIQLVNNKSIYKGKVIWRATTALNKHKLSGKNQHSRRFLTLHRVILFNAYATSQMCAAGIPVFDLFPLTESYPKGSGIAGKQFDAVHYEHKVFAAAEKRLEHILKHKII